MAVVRLPWRKWAETEKGSKKGFEVGASGSDKWAGTPAFCAIPAGAKRGKKECPGWTD
jgi:hypothetical protein